MQHKLLNTSKFLLCILPLLAIVCFTSVAGFLLFGYLLYLLLFLVLNRVPVYRLTNYKTNVFFTFAVFTIIIVLLVCVSLLDYSVVETFKQQSPFPQTSDYWRNLFNIFLPVIWCGLGCMYWLGSGNLGKTAKIIIAGVFLEYSSLNDFLYYLLHGVPLPTVWTWIYTPQFLFGINIATSELVLWLLLMVGITGITLYLPLESLFEKD